MIRIISFGYGHGPAPTADMTYDLRGVLLNPHHDPAMQDLTAQDQKVYDHVMATAGAERLAMNGALTARTLALDTGAEVTVAWGCTGGRHRSVALADCAANWLRDLGETVVVDHRDVTKALLPPGTHSRPRT